MRVLVLEDNEDRQATFRRRYLDAAIVATAPECVERLTELWDLVFLDHDLGGRKMPDSESEDCGYEVVRWIVAHQPEYLRQTRFIVHSANPIRSRIMVADLNRAGYDAELKSFINLLPELKAGGVGSDKKHRPLERF